MTRYRPTGERGRPDRPGYYWAKWIKAADGTREGDEVTPSPEWEIVQVDDNYGAPGTEEEFSVLVAGVEQVQWRYCFIWGPRVADLDAPASVTEGEAPCPH